MDEAILIEDCMSLLEQFWILRNEDDGAYFRLKENEERLKPFLEGKLGYRMHINPYLIKLDKVPGEAEPWMGIETFQSPMDYCFLLLLLSFLEDRGPDEQFVLSDVTEYVMTMYPEKDLVDWTIYQHRRSLVRALGFARNMGIININDGDDERFSQSRDVEVLYESTGISRYFLRPFARDITEAKDQEEILSSQWVDMDEERGILRRHRVYRKLVLSPVVYPDGADDQDFYYIRNYRNTIQKDLEEFMGARLHVHKDCALTVISEDYGIRDSFPSQNNLSDIALQISTLLRRQISKGKRKPGVEGSIEMTQVEFEALLRECHKEFSHGWYKTYREMREDKLIKEVKEYMIGWKMVKEDPKLKTLKILPLCLKIKGEFPAEYRKGDRQ